MPGDETNNDSDQNADNASSDLSTDATIDVTNEADGNELNAGSDQSPDAETEGSLLEEEEAITPEVETLGNGVVVDDKGSASAAPGAEYVSWRYSEPLLASKNDLKQYAAENGLKYKSDLRGGNPRLVDTEGNDVTEEHASGLATMREGVQTAINNAVNTAYDEMLQSYVADKNINNKDGINKYEYKDGKVTRTDGKPFNAKKFKKYCQKKGNGKELAGRINDNLAKAGITGIKASRSRSFGRGKIKFSEVKIKMLGESAHFDGQSIVANKAKQGGNWEYRSGKHTKRAFRNAQRKFAAENGYKYKNGELFDSKGKNVTEQHADQVADIDQQAKNKIDSAISKANNDFLSTVSEQTDELSATQKDGNTVVTRKDGEPLNKKDVKNFKKYATSRKGSQLKAVLINERLKEAGITNTQAYVKRFSGKLAYRAPRDQKIKVLNQTSATIDSGIASIKPVKGTHWKTKKLSRSSHNQERNAMRHYAQENGIKYDDGKLFDVSGKDITAEHRAGIEESKKDYDSSVSDALKQGFDSFKADFAKEHPDQFVYVDKDGEPIPLQNDDGSELTGDELKEKLKGGRLMHAGDPPSAITKQDMKDFKRYEKEHNGELQDSVNKALEDAGFPEVKASVSKSSRFSKSQKVTLKTAKVKFLGETAFYNGKGIVAAKASQGTNWDYQSSKHGGRALKNATLLYAQENGLKYKNGKLYKGGKDITQKHQESIEKTLGSENDKVSSAIEKANDKLMSAFCDDTKRSRGKAVKKLVKNDDGKMEWKRTFKKPVRNKYKIEKDKDGKNQVVRADGKPMKKSDLKKYKKYDSKHQRQHARQLNQEFSAAGLNVSASRKGLFSKKVVYKTSRIKLVGKTTIYNGGAYSSAKPAKGQGWEFSDKIGKEGNSQKVSNRNAMKSYAQQNGLKYKKGELYDNGEKVTEQHKDGIEQEASSRESEISQAIQNASDKLKADLCDGHPNYVFVDKDGEIVNGERLNQDPNCAIGGKVMRAGDPPQPFDKNNDANLTKAFKYELKAYEKKNAGKLSDYINKELESAGLKNIDVDVKANKGLRKGMSGNISIKVTENKNAKLKFLGKSGFFDGEKIVSQNPKLGSSYNFTNDKHTERHDNGQKVQYAQEHGLTVKDGRFFDGKKDVTSKHADDFKEFKTDSNKTMDAAIKEGYDNFRQSFVDQNDNYEMSDKGIVRADGKPMTKADYKEYQKFEKGNRKQLADDINDSLSKNGINHVQATKSGLMGGKIKYKAVKIKAIGSTAIFDGKAIKSVSVAKKGVHWDFKNKGAIKANKNAVMAQYAKDNDLIFDKKKGKLRDPLTNKNVTKDHIENLTEAREKIETKMGQATKDAFDDVKAGFASERKNNSKYTFDRETGELMRKPKKEGGEPRRMRKKDIKRFQKYEKNHQNYLARQTNVHLQKQGIHHALAKAGKNGIEMKKTRGGPAYSITKPEVSSPEANSVLEATEMDANNMDDRTDKLDEASERAANDMDDMKDKQEASEVAANDMDDVEHALDVDGAVPPDYEQVDASNEIQDQIQVQVQAQSPDVISATPNQKPADANALRQPGKPDPSVIAAQEAKAKNDKMAEPEAQTGPAAPTGH